MLELEYHILLFFNKGFFIDTYEVDSVSYALDSQSRIGSPKADKF